MIRVIIVSDIVLYREALAKVIDSNGHFTVVDTASDTRTAIKKLHRSKPDVVLLDMTILDSCDVIKQICPSFLNTKIVALAITEDQDRVFACAKAGITGYVSRDASLDKLLDTIKAVANGEIYCSRQIAASLFKKLNSTFGSSHNNKVDGIEKGTGEPKDIILTGRERQVATLISDGLSNKQIARKLTIEVSTVKNHIHNILSKTGAHNRIQVMHLLQQSYI